MPSYVYILSNQKSGALYIGVTTDLIKRIYEHKEGITKGFASRYNIKRLVYYEIFEDVRMAIEREKELKKWRREWKIALFEKSNPDWRDLYGEIVS